MASPHYGLNLTDEFGLSPRQLEAARVVDRDVIVTAGAGSGKTRTLVAHYLYALSQGRNPREVAAITFTEKAALEMRSRVRSAVSNLAVSVSRDEDRSFWQEVEAGMDAARIGTIHSLCAEILRSHPVEAGIDPRYRVLEEGLVQALKAQIAADTLVWAVDQTEVIPVFNVFSTRRVSDILHHALNHRLDVIPLLQDRSQIGIERFLLPALESFISTPVAREAESLFQALVDENRLLADAGEKLAEQIVSLLKRLEKIRNALKRGEAMQAARQLFDARRTDLKLGSGKKTSEARALLSRLQMAYDDDINAWLGGKKRSDPPPSMETEQAYTDALPYLCEVIEQAFRNYAAELEARSAVDFDDLEQGAVNLLRLESIRDHWQREIQQLMVDEFQDTNRRQREIVEAINGECGGLFVVGDARQSIYRFRGADVTVFRSLYEAIRDRGGAAVELDKTYRSHSALALASENFLEALMGSPGDDVESYEIPYERLSTHRKLPRRSLACPLEIIAGVGEDATRGKRHAARQLALRLLELRQEGVILAWEEVALLFRASTAFETYEIELERAGVPFVTIAGRGFFNRPEIRDVLNALAAIEKPWDELALAGWLRSPVVGLRDDSLAILCSVEQPLYIALQQSRDLLSREESQVAEAFLDRYEILHEKCDRIPVAVLLEEMLNRFDYRPLMSGVSSRMQRNLEKLVEDARTSGLVRVGEFLTYIKTLRDVGARESEAPVEVEGAVQLMTIHKAKGLEFPIVVLADASYKRRSGGDILLARSETGLTAKPDRIDMPIIQKYAQQQEVKQEAAEAMRLLYVAATRAEEILILNGHLLRRTDSVSVSGWFGEILEGLGMEAGQLVFREEPFQVATLPNGAALRIMGQEDSRNEQRLQPPLLKAWPESRSIDIFKPIYIKAVPDEAEEDPGEEPKTEEERFALALGKLTHAVLEAGVTLTSEQQENVLNVLARESLFDKPAARERAMTYVMRMLNRLRENDLWETLLAADERYHEFPLIAARGMVGKRQGRIDLLYRVGDFWYILDFKTDAIETGDELQKHVRSHERQLFRYAKAVEAHLGVRPAMQLCFLNFNKQIKVEELGSDRTPSQN